MRLAGYLLFTVTVMAQDDPSSWRYYLGDLSRTHYSELKQITRENVGKLEVAWEYKSGGEAQIQCNPIIVEGMLYGVSAERNIFARDAGTGKEKWRFTPPDPLARSSVLRGVQYWESGRDKRLMVAVGHHVYALNSRTGRLRRP